MAKIDLRGPQVTSPSIEDVEASVQHDLARRESRARISAIVAPTSVALAVTALWEVGAHWFEIPAFLLPAPSAIVLSMGANAALLLHNGWVTTLEIVLGFLLSIVVGIPLALAIFHRSQVGRDGDALRLVALTCFVALAAVYTTERLGMRRDAERGAR